MGFEVFALDAGTGVMTALLVSHKDALEGAKTHPDC